jgi:hypothetical protein
MVAVGGPPPGIAQRVRYVGDEHAGFVAYIEGRAERARLDYFQLEEPDEQRRRFGSLGDEAQQDDEPPAPTGEER